MGMFDKTEGLTKQTDFDTSQPFMLWDAKFLGKTVSRQYGENVTAEVTAGPVNTGQDAAKKYVCYGVLAEMIQRMESGDLPATVRIIKDGEANIFAKVS